MFKLHKPYTPGCIHSGHFMVSRLDDDEDNNDPEDDTSESERDNANSVEIDVTNPDSVVDAKNLDINYVVKSPAANELTSWNDLDRPSRKHSQKQYLTYFTSNHHQSSEDIPTDVTQAASSSEMCLEGTSQQSSSQDQNQLNPNLNDPHNRNQHDRRVARNAYFAQQAHHQQSHNHQNLNQPHQLLHNQRLYQLRHEHQLTERQKQKLLSLNPHQSANPLEAMNAVANQTGASSSDLLLSSESALQLSQHLQHQHNQQACLCQNNISAMHQNQHQHHHHQHAVTIDTSLTKLLECMSLYYSSNLTSPKWKSFKGLKLRLKYKIRLNNLIWRAWFLQCIRGRRPPGCQFNAPVETDDHKKSETIVLEGKYWKRKEKAIVDEYKKWRIFHKQKTSQVNFFRPVSLNSE